ncbi:periplasmic-binding protein [Plautia stali symbiont]|nr:periplasmic-binding protein [Plautia stali symbiont]
MAKYLLLGLWLLCHSLLAAPRVITLSPHLTELAFAAGITPVAVSAWSDYPAAASQLEQVANWQGIRVERIVQLRPDVVLSLARWQSAAPGGAAAASGHPRGMD